MARGRRRQLSPTSASRIAESRSPAEEWDRLATALNLRGVRHLRPGREAGLDAELGDEALYVQLFRARAVRLQEAAVGLLLARPDTASAARRAIIRLEGAERDRAMRRYVAAAALQRMWKSRLELWLGARPLVEPAYLEELGLPSLETDHGRATLWALAGQEEARYGYDAWAGYQSLMELLLAEMATGDWGRPGARAG